MNISFVRLDRGALFQMMYAVMNAVMDVDAVMDVYAVMEILH